MQLLIQRSFIDGFPKHLAAGGDPDQERVMSCSCMLDTTNQSATVSEERCTQILLVTGANGGGDPLDRSGTVQPKDHPVMGVFIIANDASDDGPTARGSRNEALKEWPASDFERYGGQGLSGTSATVKHSLVATRSGFEFPGSHPELPILRDDPDTILRTAPPETGDETDLANHETSLDHG